ncbi:MAG: hypothetical protein CVV47_16680 [Spirochaetae bacterium HGW-Spirochaetae-3]|jgi:hypothetical protein|nr:MAG: hypothetical protein CVV47_16680 [Spirochaetae bacterium HGW-Spirochaetae-3]HOY89756.1 hypothetical protein [Bacillota bacterium]
MKRTLVIIITILILGSTGFAQSRNASYPLANGHKLIVTNLLKPELWGFFDNAGLADALSKISDEYELSTDIAVAFNPTATYLYLPVQGIEFDPAKATKIAPITDSGLLGEAQVYYLPTSLQKQVMLAVVEWVRSFINNTAVPEELRSLINKLVQTSPPRFICSITNKHRTIMLSGTIPALQYISFEPKIQWQDISNYQSPIFATIAIPAPYNDTAITSVQGRLYLENPDIPGNPTVKKDTIWIYKLFGLQ